MSWILSLLKESPVHYTNNVFPSTVSEAVCKEYEQLKRQYDVETGAMHKAMQQASQVGQIKSLIFL